LLLLLCFCWEFKLPDFCSQKELYSYSLSILLTPALSSEMQERKVILYVSLAKSLLAQRSVSKWEPERTLASWNSPDAEK
jgi:hypothetical protein